jgi:hypothetical protein
MSNHIRSPRTVALGFLSGVGLLVGTAAPAHATAFNVTYEAAGVENANQTALCANLGSGTCTVGVDTFNGMGVGSWNSFTTNYGTGGTITGTYTNATISAAGQFGGAGGTGDYIATSSTAGYQLNLTTTLATGVNYFGFWLSALDAGNDVSFYKNGVDVFDFTPSQVIAALGSCTGSTKSGYCGNPSGAFAGQDSTQQYVFVNFFDIGGSFDSIHFSENPTVGAYESDNHTVGYVTAETGIQVPEPASILLFAGGVAGLLGLRRRLG